MIANSICPYCSIELIKAENMPNSRSVEHLVPNTLLTRKRKNDEGDFYACRQCNSNKGNLDELFGFIAKSQSSDNELASKALIRAFTKRDHVPNRLWKMYDSARKEGNEVHAKMPITGQELLDYATYFGKGLYFLKYQRVFNDSKDALYIEFANKQVHSAFSSSYEKKLNSNPIRDLEKNQYSKVVASGECVIWSKNRKNLVVFHDFISFSIEFKNRNQKTLRKKFELDLDIIEGFG